MKENTVQVFTDCWPAISLPLPLSFIFLAMPKIMMEIGYTVPA